MIKPKAPYSKPLLLNYSGVEIHAGVLIKHSSSLRLGLSLVKSASIVVSKEVLKDLLRDLVVDHVKRNRVSQLVVTGARTGATPLLRLTRLIKPFSRTALTALFLSLTNTLSELIVDWQQHLSA